MARMTMELYPMKNHKGTTFYVAEKISHEGASLYLNAIACHKGSYPGSLCTLADFLA